MSLSLIERTRRLEIPAALIVHDDWVIYGPGFDQWIRMWRGRRRLLAPVAETLLGVPTSVDLADAGRFLFNSRYTEERAGLVSLSPSNKRVVYPGIEPALRQARPRRPWGWRLLYLGRIDRQKGIDTAVQALIHLPTEATLEVWGTGNDRYLAEMRGLASEHGLADRVRFHGWAGPEERLSAYDNADVVVFPVRWAEPFGLVPLEAMGLGRPVVSTLRGGAAEFLCDGENALIFEADDPRGLADAVSRLAAQEPLRERLLEGGRETANRFTVERFADEAVGEIVRAAQEPLAHQDGDAER
jgi:glycosyltransferase involved in cell wall biosynthesis